MRTVNILFNSIEHIKNFTDTVSKLAINMEIVCGRYVIDAKSIVGICTLNLSQPLELRIHEDGERAEEVIGQLMDYLV